MDKNVTSIFEFIRRSNNDQKSCDSMVSYKTNKEKFFF